MRGHGGATGSAPQTQGNLPAEVTQCGLQGLLMSFPSYPQTPMVPLYRVPVTGADRPWCGEQRGRGEEGSADGDVHNRPRPARSPERRRALRESPPAPPLRGVSRAPGHGAGPAASTPGGAHPGRPALASGREQGLPAVPGPACPLAPQGQ